MNYERDILYILSLAKKDEGVSVKAVAMHVYNRNCGFFSDVSFADIHAKVSQWLWRKSRRHDSLIDHAPRWGRYTINPKKKGLVVQLLLPLELEN